MLANTKQQNLYVHSFAIAYLSKLIFEKVVSKDIFKKNIDELNMDCSNYSYEKISNIVFNAGIFHDLGKIDENFQSFLSGNKKDKLEYDVQIENKKTDKKKFNFESYPRHHELSWSLLSVFGLNNNEYTNYHKELCEYVVYWHHAKTIRKNNENFTSNEVILKNKNINFSDLKNNTEIFLDEVINLMNNYGVKIELLVNLKELNEDEAGKKIPSFQKDNIFSVISDTMIKDQASLFKNSLNYLLRSILITSDRIISSLSNEDLVDYVKNKQLDVLLIELDGYDNSILMKNIEEMKEKFESDYPNSERNKEQNNAAKGLNNSNSISVLSGPAGVGKTKIMLEWVCERNKNKRVYIIAPKTSICFSLYEELKSQYLKNSSIQLITGENKYYYKNNHQEELQESSYFTSDVVITTIDQMLMLMLSHKKIDVFLDVLNSTLIFDEFHEYLDQSAILMLFIQIIQLKKVFNNNDCLLVSATPNYFLLENLLGLHEQNIVKIDSFNKKEYSINIEFFDDTNASELSYKMYDSYNKGTILIFNTAQKSQFSAIFANKKSEKNTLVYNSRLLKDEKIQVFKKIKKEFGKNTLTTRNNVLRTGPILQASVDISTNNMFTELSTIDNIYQRMGRLNRWGDEDKAQYTIFIPKDFDVNSKKDSIKLALGNNINATIVFKEFLLKQKQLKSFQLKDFYQLYEDFFKNDERVKESYKKDWNLIKEECKKTFKSNFEPLEYPKKKVKSDVKTMSSNSLRGNSIFVYVADLNYTKNGGETKIFATNKDDFNKQTVSWKKDIYSNPDDDYTLIEENKKQLKNHTDFYIACEIYSNLNKKTILKNDDILRVRPIIFKNFARGEDTPLMLSFQKIKNGFDEENEFYNIRYADVILGVMKVKDFNKVK